MTVYKRNDSKSFHYDFRLNGRRYHGSTDKGEKRAAQTFERDLRRQIEANSRLVPRRGRMLSLGEAGSKYLEYGILSTACRATSRQNRITEVRRLVSDLGPAIYIADLDDQRIAEFVKKRQDDSNGRIRAATINRYLRVLRKVLTYASSSLKAHVNEIQWAKLKLRDQEFEVVMITKHEEQLIKPCLDPVDAAIFDVAMGTTLRMGDIVKLSWRHVDLENLTLEVLQKGGTWHTAALTKRLAGIIEAQRGRHSEFVFAYDVKRRQRTTDRADAPLHVIPVQMGAHYKRWRKALRLSGIRPRRRHDIRHSGAKRTLDVSKNLVVVQRQLGHKSLRSTMRYLRYCTDDVRAAMEAVEEANA